MLPKARVFTWTGQRLRAAYLLGLREHTHRQIAALVGITRMTLHRWRKRPEFVEKLREIEQEQRLIHAAQAELARREWLEKVQAVADERFDKQVAKTERLIARRERQLAKELRSAGGSRGTTNF